MSFASRFDPPAATTWDCPSCLCGHYGDSGIACAECGKVGCSRCVVCCKVCDANVHDRKCSKEKTCRTCRRSNIPLGELHPGDVLVHEREGILAVAVIHSVSSSGNPVGTVTEYSSRQLACLTAGQINFDGFVRVWQKEK